MVTKNKVLEFILKYSKKLEDNWENKLDELNLWDDVAEIYYLEIENVKEVKRISRLEANTVLSFIVLAYDLHSPMLEAHKNRFDNKVKIITKLAGPSALTNKVYHDLVYSQETTCNKVITWYISYQKDSRWNMILANKEFAAQATAMAMGGPSSAADGVNIGKMLKEAKEREDEADKMIDMLKNEFLNLDTVLEKEDRVKATDMSATNFMSHEGYLRSRFNRHAKENAKPEKEKTN